MVFLHFVCKLLSSIRKQHIAAVFSEVFCLWLLTSKYCLIHPFLIDIIVIFSGVLRPIYEVPHGGELAQLILVSKVFLAAKGFYDIGGFLLYCSALRTSLAHVQGLSLMVITFNSTALKENGMTEDIFFISFRPKNICVWSSNRKRSMIMTIVFLSLAFHLQKHTNPTSVIDAKQ